VEEKGQNALEVGKEAQEKDKESPETQSRRSVISGFAIKAHPRNSLQK
jgi:hypothetical protein